MKASASALLLTASAAGLALIGPTQTRAQGLQGWQFEVSPYIWAAGVDGTIKPLRRGPSFESSLSFGDILDNLDAGIFVTGSARRDRLVLMGDLYYISLSDTVRRTVLGTTASLQGEATILQGTLVGGWRAIDTPAGSLDLMAGVRAGENDIEIRAKAGDTTLLRGRDDITYAAPILALRGRVALNDRVSLTGYGDLGGGTSSVDST